MSSIRKLQCLVAALSLSLLAAAGCSKDKEAGKEGAEGAAKTGDPAAAAATGRFSYLPADSNLVLGVNVAQIRGSKLFKDMAEPIIMQQAGGDYEKFKTACGFDPLDQVKSLTVGGNTSINDKVAISVKGINADQLKKCGEAVAAAQGEKMEIAQEGSLTKVVSDGQTSWIGWADDTTMVTSGDNKALLEQLMGSKETLGKDLMELVGKVDTDAALWLAVLDNGDANSPLASAPVKVKAAYGSINLSGGLAINAALRQTSPEEAQKTVADFTAQLEQFKQSPYGKYVSKLELKASETDVLVKLALNDAELQELMQDPSIQALGAMMGMGAMGAAGGAGDGM